MKLYCGIYNYFKTIKYSDSNSSSGFTLLETLTVVLVISILSAIAISNWVYFVNLRHLNVAQNDIYQAMRQGQSQAKKEKLTWQVSFREENSSGIVQWAVHPVTVNPGDAIWNSLAPNVRLDDETTLQLANGVRQIQFDYLGSVRKPPLGRITLSIKSGGKTKRCVIVSTILGAMRTAKENSKANNSGNYCY
jgi:prepilin-type N-terminal cleavage/methylation domain-containing protein